MSNKIKWSGGCAAGVWLEFTHYLRVKIMNEQQSSTRGKVPTTLHFWGLF